MLTREDYINFHCPRYDEFPTVELYAEQVLSLIKEYLSPFYKKEQMLLTANMINNYVKQKIVKPPINKRYDRVHLSYFVVVCLFKGFMNISELCEGLELILATHTVKEAYNMFCDELENALKKTFSKNTQTRQLPVESDELLIMRSMCTSFANLTLVHFMIDEKRGKNE